ncbi:MAG: rRNA adenine N-6-methyltransferase family protein, partial [Cyanobacteria bacterium J06626_14]
MSNRPRKRFGQHWLRSESVLQQIVDAADLQPGDRLLEIGPGKGVLTR